MARITSDCDAIRIHEHQMGLITLGRVQVGEVASLKEAVKERLTELGREQVSLKRSAPPRRWWCCHLLL